MESQPPRTVPYKEQIEVINSFLDISSYLI